MPACWLATWVKARGPSPSGSAMSPTAQTRLLDVERRFLPVAMPRGVAATFPAGGVGDLQALLVELLITFILVFVVISVATDDRVPGAVAPVAVGLALAAGVFIAGPVTGGAVNPARALGPMLVAGEFTAAWVYVVGPIAGGVLAALLYDRFISAGEEPG